MIEKIKNVKINTESEIKGDNFNTNEFNNC
jgi:hypothetical protein